LTGPTLLKPVTTPASLEEAIPVMMPAPIVRATDSQNTPELGSGAVAGVSPPSSRIGSLNQIPKNKELA